MLRSQKISIPVFLLLAVLTLTSGCSTSSEDSASDSGTSPDTEVLKDALSGSGLYSYTYDPGAMSLYLTQMYTSNDLLYTQYLWYLFNENSNLLEQQDYTYPWSDCYLIRDGQWTKVTEKLDWDPEYSFDTDGSMITSNVFGSYRTKVLQEKSLDGLNMKSVLDMPYDALSDTISEDASFSSGAHMIEIYVTSMTKHRLYLTTDDSFSAEGYYGSFNTMADLIDYFLKDNSGRNYIHASINSYCHAQFDTDGTIYFYDNSSHDLLSVTGRLTQESVDGATFYAAEIPAECVLYGDIEKVILKEIDGSVKKGFWYEEFFENDRLYLFNESGINEIKDALQRALQQ